MIVVLGRPGLAAHPPAVEGGDALDGLAARVAVAVAAAGAPVQLVGSIGDDAEGDEVIIQLGRANVGHAALLRDPTGRTPVAGEERAPSPRLDAQDVGLGLQYLADIRLLVLAESLDASAERAALDAAGYHEAAVVAVVPSGHEPPAGLGATGTALQAPEGDLRAFAEFVGRYAAALADGTPPAEAFASATAATGWERSEG